MKRAIVHTPVRGLYPSFVRLYATGKDLSVSLCGETKPLSEAGADLEALGDGEAPDDGGTPPILREPSRRWPS
jgi:hypothetical protein